MGSSHELSVAATVLKVSHARSVLRIIEFAHGQRSGIESKCSTVCDTAKVKL